MSFKSVDGIKTYKTFELKHLFEFDSNRKRMSVIVKRPNSNEFVLYCKGADSSIFAVADNTRLYCDCLQHFSENGWRILVLSYTTLSEQEMKVLNTRIDDAKNDILNREARLADIYDQVERNLHLIGVTAVEDKLQENVQDTLFALREAGIKIWVLTGDKLETAINISESCKHFSPDMVKYVMANMSETSCIKSELLKINQMYFLN